MLSSLRVGARAAPTLRRGAALVPRSGVAGSVASTPSMANHVPAIGVLRQYTEQRQVVKGAKMFKAEHMWEASTNTPLTKRTTNHLFGTRVVAEGERAWVVNHNGKGTIVEGPRRVPLVMSSFTPLNRFTAAPTEYLTIHTLSGDVETVPGPASVWYDPTLHQDIKVHTAVELNNNESLVVYSGDPAGEATREIVRGPRLFVPKSGQWMHSFNWHGHDPDSSERGAKKPQGLKFTKIRECPDQMYVDCESVRTSDDALLRLQLMLFFQLEDLEHCLDHTHDPIADMSNALGADVINFASERTFDSLKGDCPQLNDLEAYPQLLARAKSIGFKINKVVFRGYHTNDTLQRMQDVAIKTRTEAILAKEQQEQLQAQESFKLACEEERAERKTKLALAVQKLEEDAKLESRKQWHELQLAQDRAKQAAEVRTAAAAHKEEARHLAELAAMGVDLTQYLVARTRNPDKVIELVGAGGGTGLDRSNPVALHVHSSEE